MDKKIKISPKMVSNLIHKVADEREPFLCSIAILNFLSRALDLSEKASFILEDLLLGEEVFFLDTERKERKGPHYEVCRACGAAGKPTDAGLKRASEGEELVLYFREPWGQSFNPVLVRNLLAQATDEQGEHECSEGLLDFLQQARGLSREATGVLRDMLAGEPLFLERELWEKAGAALRTCPTVQRGL